MATGSQPKDGGAGCVAMTMTGYKSLKILAERQQTQKINTRYYGMVPTQV